VAIFKTFSIQMNNCFVMSISAKMLVLSTIKRWKDDR
jgi:hypothetical protein